MKYTRFLYKHWDLLIILCAWLVFSYPYFFQGLVPFPSRYLVDFFPPWSYEYAHPFKNGAMPDIITQIYPWKQLVVESWKDGYVPRWNPYQFAGNPLLANTQSAVLSPFNLLFFILPFIDAWSMMILLQPLLAGLFTYLFARSIGMTKSGAVISSLSFMFCGFIVTWMAYGTLGFAALYLPLLLFGVERMFRTDKTNKTNRSGNFFLIAFSIALSIFSGHFQTSVYVLGVGAVYGAWLIFISFRRGDAHRFTNASYIAVAFTSGIILSFPQVFPSMNFYAQSLRSELFGRGGEVVPIQYLVTLMAPDFYGNPVTRNDWFGHYAEWSGFAGVVPLILAGISCIGYRYGKRTLFFIILFFMTIVSAYSQTINNMLVSLQVPVLSTSAASRIIVISSFSIAILAGNGLDIVTKYWSMYKKPEETVRIKWIVYSVFTICAFLWATILIGNIFFMSEATTDQLHVARRNFILPSLLATGTVLLIVLAPKVRRLLPIVVIILIGMTAFDMLRFSGKWMPFDERKFVYPQTGVLEYLNQNSGYHRVFSNFKNPAFGTSGLYGLEGYDPLYITRYAELVAFSADGIQREPERSVVQISVNGIYTQRLFDMTGVKYIAHAKGDARNVWAYPFWEYPEHYGDAVFSDDYYEVYENRNVYPRAYLVYDYAVVSDDAGLLSRVFDESVDLKKTVLLEKQPSITAQGCAEFDPTAVDIKTYRSNEVLIHVSAPCDAMLVLSDAYYPGWDVYVGSEKKEILRANYTFRAVPVPKGESDVTFIYENWYR